MSTIQLKHTETKHHDALLYNLPEDQIPFTALPSETFERLKLRTDGHAKPITILLDEVPIGFFVLDYGDDKLEMTNNTNSLLLRSLSINPEFQGKGYGKISMNLMDDFVKDNFPTIDELVLAVNFNNKSAYDLYLKVGYIDDGSQREWFNGMQHLLKKKI
ncbi:MULTISPECIES: GNAT family N-acetyltransferase [unclassified Empedobacter]|uniref:GNAT family N-acetyltransferase n=1 Tax=unclassified Empedobacter TaxID=2643773 RepID=UPI0025BDD5E3|nr:MULTISPECIES: GNAT family N-acetyltransferase [unclassified Empedobacter]